MKITFEIKDEHISKLKYLILGVFIILAISYAYFFEGANTNIYLLLAVIFAIYMAINLGANDVANNMGPAVGAKAISLGGAIILAMIFEASGALIAGSDVIDTIKGGIIDRSQIEGEMQFIAIMLSTLLGAALWVNIATFLKAPVSITHAIFGGLIGAGITSAGLSIVNWGMVGKIAIAWVIAIFMGAFVAILLYISIRKTILKQSHMGEAAKHWVPIYVAMMTGIFALYLILKGFKSKMTGVKEFLENYSFSFNAMAIFVSVIIGVSIYTYLIIKYKNKQKTFFEDNKEFVNKLFNLPLVFAVALLSFAHGANDVANAIGPLAAIYEEVKNTSESVSKIGVPFWIMILGALFLSLGLAVFGARLIKTVGNQITKLDQTMAYSIALSAATTVIIASALGIPVSTTQIALGGVFGIGLYRQYLKRKQGKTKEVIKISKLKGILLSWVVTLPVAGAISAMTYLVIMNVS